MSAGAPTFEDVNTAALAPDHDVPSVLSRLRAGRNLTEKQEHCLRRTWAKYERFWTC